MHGTPALSFLPAGARSRNQLARGGVSCGAATVPSGVSKAHLHAMMLTKASSASECSARFTGDSILPKSGIAVRSLHVLQNKVRWFRARIVAAGRHAGYVSSAIPVAAKLPVVSIWYQAPRPILICPVLTGQFCFN